MVGAVAGWAVVSGEPPKGLSSPEHRVFLNESETLQPVTLGPSSS